MGTLHRLTAGLPQCMGDCGQGRRPCESPAHCQAAEIRAAQMAGRGMACAEPTTSPADLGSIAPIGPIAPSIPRRRRLTESALDRRIADKASRPMPLPDLLLAKGAMTGPHRWPLLRRLRTWWRQWRVSVMGTRL